jgi:CHAT domain-containing protein/tetratricopeptide (TPR) repeat protein
MKAKLLQATGSLTLAVLALTAWWIWPHYLLRSAAATIDELYAGNRPFPYRWNGAKLAAAAKQQGSSGCVAVSEANINKPRLRVAEAEKHIGATVRSFQLWGRIDLLLCQPKDAITKYKLALLLQPDDPSLNLELGIAFAVDAGMDPRLEHEGALDYEDALEATLRSGKQNQSAEFLFDSALLFQEARLPRQAEKQWEQAAQAERSPAWRREDLARRVELLGLIEKRRQKMEEFTSSPAEFLVHRDEAREGAELALGTAVESWLPEMNDSAASRQALKELGSTLLSYHHDRWLLDVMEARPFPRMKEAFNDLAEAVRYNVKGEHLRAAAFAHEAETLFRRSNNTAGELRARIETVYSLDRRSQPKACMAALKGLGQPARRRGYTWIAAQAWLEEITCRTRTRHEDVIKSRKDAYEWITAYTGYEGLRLRALGFLTEEYVSADSRLTLWQRGEFGLRSFWSTPLPALRGYALYVTLAQSASGTGHQEATVVLLRESALLMEQPGRNAIHALVLSYLGASQLKAGEDAAAKKTFAEVDEEYKGLDAAETVDFRRQSEAIDAEALIATDHPKKGLALLQPVIQGLEWPYKELIPNIRRQLLPALGDAYLGQGQFMEACRNYRQSLTETRDSLQALHDRAQRDNALHEVEPAWRGMTAVALKLGHPNQALKVWEEFRSSRSRTGVEALGEIPDCSTEDSSPIPVPEGPTIVVYAVVPGGISGWIVSHQGIEQHLINPEAKKLALRFTELAASPDSPPKEISAIGQKLFEFLLAPFAHKLPRSGTLIIDADGALAGIPWNALEDRPGHPLLERFSFSQELGLADLLTPGKNQEVDLNKILILGSPALQGRLSVQYPDLPDASREAKQLHRRFPHSLLLEGTDATAAALRSHAEQASLFHFNGHGISYGGFGALLLAPAGADLSTEYLTAHEISGLNLRGMQLVVLAACSSGVGEHAGVVNLDSLTRAFLEAGASRVIAANWDVNSSYTSELMTAFYNRLATGQKPADALRQAELALRDKYPQPRFWAAFRVFGIP